MGAKSMHQRIYNTSKKDFQNPLNKFLFCRYNISGFLEELPQLPENRLGHACVALPNGVRPVQPTFKTVPYVHYVPFFVLLHISNLCRLLLLLEDSMDLRTFLLC